MLFALNPKDQFHRRALRQLTELREKQHNLHVPDTAILEFQVVLRSVDTKPEVVGRAMLALRRALQINGVTEAPTLSTELLARQCEIEQKHDLTYFDSLIAASALSLDRTIISDDDAFDRVPSITRISLS